MVTTKLNEERGQTGDLRQEREAAAMFIDTVPAHLTAQNERFRAELNNFVPTFTTDITTTTDIQKTVAQVRRDQEAARARDASLRNSPPALTAR